MGVLDVSEEKEIVRFITGSLARRGLKPDFNADWEVHGPHKGMEFQVYIGYTKDGLCVAIYPRAVYEIDDSSDWWKAYPDSRIPVL